MQDLSKLLEVILAVVFLALLLGYVELLLLTLHSFGVEVNLV